MHPGFLHWWRAHREAHGRCCCHVGGGLEGCEGRPHGGDFGGGPFGVRRPLRFLAWKLELDEPQVAKLGAILDELKTERAQAAVDDRRATSALAEAMTADPLDEARIASIAAERAKSAERLQTALAKSLCKIHATLSEEQRKRLSHLIRTGVISI